MKNIILLVIPIFFLSHQLRSQNLSLKDLLYLKNQNLADVETYVLEKKYEFQESGIGEIDIYDTAYYFSYGRSKYEYERAEKFLVYHKRYNGITYKVETFVEYQILDKEEYLRLKKEITLQGFKFINSKQLDNKAIRVSYANGRHIIYVYTGVENGITYYRVRIWDDQPNRHI